VSEHLIQDGMLRPRDALVEQHVVNGAHIVVRRGPDEVYVPMTYHRTYWGARLAARVYRRTGRIIGRRP
jgi:hypothetical protein